MSTSTTTPSPVTSGIPAAPAAPHVLDNPAWASLSGAHAAFAVRAGGRAARYAPDVAVFSAISDPADPRSWDALRSLAGSDGIVALSGVLTPPPAGRPSGPPRGSSSSTPRCAPSPPPRRCCSGPRTCPRCWS